MSTMKIEIFSSRCAKCRILEVQVRRAVAELGLDAEIILVHNIEAARGRGILAMPGLALNGEVVLAGMVPDEKDLRSMLLERV